MFRNERNRSQSKTFGGALLLAASLVGLAAGGAMAQADGDANARPGGVYTMSNDTAGNEILAFRRFADGSLAPAGTYATGGLGTGAGLGNQGGVILSDDHHWLFAVNAGSNDISAFAVTPLGLVLTDVEPSLGELPVSLTLHGDLLYVLNAGGAGSIHGFTVADDGDIEPIAGSMRPLSGAAMTGAAQVKFSPDGGVLVVTEKATSLIDTYVVHGDGTASAPAVFASSGQTPFGFDFDAYGRLMVSEAFGGGSGQAAASSYHVAADGTLTLISPSVSSGQTAACWLVVNPNSRHAYTTNTPAGTISSYAIDDATGALALGEAVAFDVGAGSGPLDAGFSANGRFFYTLNTGTQELGAYRVDKMDGGLTAVQFLTGLPATVNGLAAH